MKKINSLMIFLFLILGCSTNERAIASSGEFKYDPKTGKCRNEKGQVGYNTINEKFSKMFAKNNGGEFVFITEKGDAECVDLSNLDWSKYTHGMTVGIGEWDFKGSKFGKAYIPTMSIHGDFSGADISETILPYSSIGGTYDKFTLLSGCHKTPNENTFLCS